MKKNLSVITSGNVITIEETLPKYLRLKVGFGKQTISLSRRQATELGLLLIRRGE